MLCGSSVWPIKDSNANELTRLLSSETGKGGPVAKSQVPSSKKLRFQIDNDKCTGCLLCSMACSFIKTSAFGLSQSLVIIKRDMGKGTHERYSICFDDACDGCGFCAHYCNYDAILDKQHGSDG